MLALQACGSDSSGPASDSRVATSLTANSVTSMTAAAGTAVSTPPSVTVKDQNGSSMPGVTVVFAVASGGGVVTGGSATSDASGVATVGSWTLGATAGANTLTASTTGVSAVTFTATGTVGPPASLTKTAGDAQSAVVGSAVAIAPAVTVKDAHGNLVSGASVTYAVSGGGGVVSGAGATSNASGVATLGSWALGTIAGPNTLTASSAGVASVTFTATGTAGAPASMTKTAGDAQTATAGSTVSTPPAVTLKDADGNPVGGVSVSFAVASGGGSVVGGTATSDASGLATVGGWTLGTTAGPNTLTVTAAGVAALTFAATGTAGAPATLTKTAGDAQTATVGSPVPIAPIVTVKDANDNPVSGTSVVFAVASGGGSVAGGSAISDASGVAVVGSWTLGATPGPNTLTASTTGVAAVTFSATATSGAGVPASLTKTAGDSQTAATGSAVAVPPAVTVKNASGDPVSGVSVLFTVASGGGVVTGASAMSDGAGVATVGSWTLGGGSNALIASAGGVAPVSFAATSFCAYPNHSIGSTTNGSLSPLSCWWSDGRYVDFYSTTTTTDAFLFTLTSGDFDTFLYLWYFDTAYEPIASNDDANGTTNSAIKILLPAGNYTPGASSFAPGETGSYALSSSVTSADVANCETVFVVRGVSTTQNVASVDCVTSQYGFYSDDFLIYLEAGRAVDFVMESTAFDAYLILYDASGTVVTYNNDEDASTTNSRLVYTPTVSGYYRIEASTYVSSTTGPYTLTIQ